MNMGNFRDFWKSINSSGEEFYKSASLSKSELRDIRNYIKALQAKNAPSSVIIKHLQKFNSKLSEAWKAERAYWTEVKRMETKTIGDAADELDISKYRVVLSPSACEICRKKTDNGKREFHKSDLEKSGYGHVPPFHPNCYCVVIPK